MTAKAGLLRQVNRDRKSVTGYLEHANGERKVAIRRSGQVSPGQVSLKRATLSGHTGQERRDVRAGDMSSRAGQLGKVS
jgi:hypothetical protein